MEDAKTPIMFVFGSAANNVSSDRNDDTGAVVSVDGTPSFAFDASFLSAVTATADADDEPSANAAHSSQQRLIIDVCANCGQEGGGGGVKLKDCTACRLVKYCGVDCQKAHRKQHKAVCKQRAAELKDEQLYSQGHERPEGDFCPICTLPIPILMGNNAVFRSCCMEKICNGCNVAAQKRGMSDCPFCRTPRPDNDGDKLAMIRARVEKKDPEAIYFLGDQYYHGKLGLQMDMRKAVELYTEAAELGSAEALFSLGDSYYNGYGVQKDEAKSAEYYKKAAIQGHVESRNNLGGYEELKGTRGRAVKHYLISAKMGNNVSVENMKRMFTMGIATKEQYAEALKGYQDALEEMKSHDRDEAKAYLEQQYVEG